MNRAEATSPHGSLKNFRNLFSSFFWTMFMLRKTKLEFETEIENAKKRIQLNEKYFHYKNPERHYTVTGLVILEETDGIGILYRAEYEDLQGVVFVRPIKSFLAEVDTENGRVKRFSLVENNNSTH